MTRRRLALLFLLSLGNFVSAAEPAAQLLLPSRKLEPKSTFEVRFAAEMVPADQVGKPAEISPLVFQPSVEGRFLWLSTRSGTFTPAKILPLAPSAAYVDVSVAERPVAGTNPQVGG